MDDFILDDCGRPLVVAVMDLCLDWILRRRRLRVPDRSYRRRLSYFFPRDSSSFLWNLGIFLASDQPSGHGYYLVRSAGIYWRYDIHSPLAQTFTLVLTYPRRMRDFDD